MQPNLCPCGRTASSFAYDPRLAGVGTGPPVGACSLAHLKIIAKRKGNMEMPVPLQQSEYEMIMQASPIIGEYLEAQGVTDMAQMGYEQWLDFLAFNFKTFHDINAGRWADGEVPY